MFHLALIPFYALYAYVCIRCWQRVWKRLTKAHWIVFAITCILFAVCFAISRTTLYLPPLVSRIVTYTGVYWLAFVFYMILFTILTDVLILLRKFIPSAVFFKKHAFQITLFSIAASLIIVLFGSWSAYHTRIKQYAVELGENHGKKYNIVMVSDIHTGKFINVENLSTLVARINTLSPDLVLIAGDIFDNATIDLEHSDEIRAEFLKIKAKYGVYACLGNHDSYDGGTKAAAFFDNTPLHILQDQSVIIDDSFVLIGRKDHKVENREPISSLIQRTDLPIVVMDHQPNDLAEEEKAGVSLVLSGHTHYGQLFPFNLATDLVFDVDYGYAKKGGTQVIVSCGFGFWATPVRVGSFSEIVQIQLDIGQ